MVIFYSVLCWNAEILDSSYETITQEWFWGVICLQENIYEDLGIYERFKTNNNFKSNTSHEYKFSVY